MRNNVSASRDRRRWMVVVHLEGKDAWKQLGTYLLYATKQPIWLSFALHARFTMRYYAAAGGLRVASQY